MTTSTRSRAGSRPFPRGRMATLTRRVNDALDPLAKDLTYDRAREAFDAYVANPDDANATILHDRLVSAIGGEAARAALGMKPPKPGLVYCCVTIGWVTPAEAAEHRYDAYFGWDND